jgi:hypothetical protein
MGVFTTAAKTWGAEALKSSDLNAQVRDLINGFGAWTSYSPTVGGLTSSYSASGAYSQIGKLVYFRASVQLTATATGSGSVTVSLPVTSAALTAGTLMGTAQFTANSGALYFGGMAYSSTTVFIVRMPITIGSTNSTWTPAVPSGQVSGDKWMFTAVYEAA